MLRVQFHTLNLFQGIMVNVFSFSSSVYDKAVCMIYSKHSMWYYDCSCQPTSILVQNLLTLKKNNSCVCFMRINFGKFVVHSTFLIKFRYEVIMGMREVCSAFFFFFFFTHELIRGHNGNAFNRCASVSYSCFAGNCPNLFQKVLPAMVGHGTPSKTYNVRFFSLSFCYMLYCLLTSANVLYESSLVGT